MGSQPHWTADENKMNKSETNKGKDMFIFEPLALHIVWGNTKSFWRLPDKNEKNKPAELIQVCWLEVTASIDISNLRDNNKYNVSFKVSMKPDAFGWNGLKVLLMAKIGKKGKYTKKSIDLAKFTSNPACISLDEPLEINQNTKPSGDDKLYFGLYEIWSGKWKGGLLIHEAKIFQV